MSRPFSALRLEGFGHALSPQEIERFERIYRVRDPRDGEDRVNYYVLREIEARLGNAFPGNYHPTTSDGYTWRAALYFSLKGGRIAILFPHTQDMARDPHRRIVVCFDELELERVRRFAVQFTIVAENVLGQGETR